MGTSAADEPLITAGTQVAVRDEQWLVRSVAQTPLDGKLVRCTGTSELVRDQDATFLTALDEVVPLRPEQTQLVHDHSPAYRRSRLWLEALLRKTPVPLNETRLVTTGSHLLDQLEYQRIPAAKALDQLRPRILLADAVGLGKTLEVGMILAELIRRGRGERIMVVTPASILEQFQHELWTRFSIPLVRLDTIGIQRLRQKIPTSRNPFTFYKRVIISLDTVKQPGRYRHHLEQVNWDAVVIDECHSLINRGTLNNMLAHTLAPRTDTLILSSATPHNGDRRSFAELVNLLDPTAIADTDSYDREDVDHLYVRRFKQDVAAEVGANFVPRPRPETVHVAPTTPEEAVLRELAETWLDPQSPPGSDGGSRRLFPWTLFKAAISSHRALHDTVTNRLDTLETDAGEAGLDKPARREREALHRLAGLAGDVPDDNAAKITRLVELLSDIKVHMGGRAVVFSERIATLNWLYGQLPVLLDMPEKRFQLLHAGMADVRQHEIIEEFALADADVRVLLASDLAAEGVNLHRQCHDLVHFDLPWSLITIQQRNGRIDRYGQTEPPQIRYLVLKSELDHGAIRDEREVEERLAAREHEMQRTLGDAAPLFGDYSTTEEAKRIRDGLATGAGANDIFPDEPRGSFDLDVALQRIEQRDRAQTTEPPRLFDSTAAFVQEALDEVFEDPDTELGMHREDERQLISFEPPADLRRRFDALPDSYLDEQKVLERLKLTTDPAVAADELDRAHDSSDSIWPRLMWLSDAHPVVEWAVDHALARIEHDTAPAMSADVDDPTFLVQGQYSNDAGQATIVEWMAISHPDAPQPLVENMFDVLDRVELGPRMVNPARDDDLSPWQRQVPIVVAAARHHLGDVRRKRDAELDRRIAEHQRRAKTFEQQALQLADTKRGEQDATEVANTARQFGEAMRTTGDPFVRVVALLLPRHRRVQAEAR